MKIKLFRGEKVSKKLLKVNDLPLRQSFIKYLRRKSLLKTLKKPYKLTYLKLHLKA